MKKRNAEKQQHELEEKFTNMCRMYDLQGLLIGDEDRFTAAVEAFEIGALEPSPEHMRDAAFSEDEWRAKLALSEALQVEFFLFVHREGRPVIHRYQLSEETLRSGRAVHDRISEKEFLQWWAAHKKTIQTKGYRPQLTDSIKDSYFDTLLESHGMKWGGNVDGFLVMSDRDFTPTAIIENRFTEQASIYRYDPAKYYSSDIQTWFPLRLACRVLDLPLILCVYSKRPDERELIALAEVRWDEDGLIYQDNVRPCDNVFSDLEKAENWILRTIYRYRRKKE